MGFLGWLRSIAGGGDSQFSAGGVADHLAMGTVNRVLQRFASDPAAAAPLRREAVYMLSSIVFLCTVVHPRFDEHSGHGFFDRFLHCVNAYGLEAALWPSMSPSFFGMMFPQRLEAYLDVLAITGRPDSTKVAKAVERAANLAQGHLASEMQLSEDFVQRLSEMGAEQWNSSIAAFDA